MILSYEVLSKQLFFLGLSARLSIFFLPYSHALLALPACPYLGHLLGIFPTFGPIVLALCVE